MTQRTNTPSIAPIQTGIDAIDRWQRKLSGLLNSWFQRGTNALEGKPVPIAQAANDGEFLQYDASSDSYQLVPVVGSVPPASQTVLGITKLSVAPVAPASPIAVGDNDPRNADARAPTGPAGGGLGGTYPNPTVTGAPPTGAAGGDLTGTYPNPTLAAVGSAGTTGDASHAAVVTTDTKGRVTGAVATLIAIAESQVTSLVSDLAALASAIALRVTSVGATTPLASSGGTAPVISINDTAVTPAAYGDATHVASFTVDQKGRLTAAAAVAITGTAPGGAAGGDLGGTYPNPTVLSVAHVSSGVLPIANGGTSAATAAAAVAALGAVPTTRQVSAGAGLSGGGNLSADRTISMPNTGTAGTYGDATHVPQTTTDAQGRVTAVTAVAITGTTPGGSAGGDLGGTYPNPSVLGLHTLVPVVTPLTIVNATTQIPTTSYVMEIGTAPAGTTTLTATPTIATSGIADGTRLVVLNLSGNTLILQDDGHLAGTKLNLLGRTTLTLGGGYAEFIFITALGEWALFNWVGAQQVIAPSNGGTGIDTSASTGVPSIASGTWSTAAQLAASKGGTGQDTSGSTGVPVVAAGAWSVPSQLGAPYQSDAECFYFGDGSDGNFTADGTNAVPGSGWCTKSGNVYTLVRDAYLGNLTVTSPGSVNTGGFQLFVSGTLDLTAAPAHGVNRDGNAGTTAPSSTAGGGGGGLTGVSAGGSNAGSTGGAGGTTTGSNGLTPTNLNPANGGSGANGASGGTGSSGSGGSAVAGAVTSLSCFIHRPDPRHFRGSQLITGGAGGSGGGGGGGDGSAGGGGGGGGSGAGVCFLAARIIAVGVSTPASCISAVGGMGGGGFTESAGTRGGGAGGGGGGGGELFIMYESTTGSTVANMLDASGGQGGTGGNGSNSGVSGGGGGGGGATGAITLIHLSATSTSVSLATGSGVVSPVAATNATGKTGASGASNQVAFP